ncbi:alpha/beta hydrolase [Kitasatospora purpeofusca]
MCGCSRRWPGPRRGDACVDAAVDRYLLDGVLPAHDTDCPPPRP